MNKNSSLEKNYINEYCRCRFVRTALVLWGFNEYLRVVVDYLIKLGLNLYKNRFTRSIDLLRAFEILGSMKVPVEELDDLVSLRDERFIFPVVRKEDGSSNLEKSEFFRLPKQLNESSILIFVFPFSWNFEIPFEVGWVDRGRDNLGYLHRWFQGQNILVWQSTFLLLNSMIAWEFDWQRKWNLHNFEHENSNFQFLNLIRQVYVLCLLAHQLWFSTLLLTGSKSEWMRENLFSKDTKARSCWWTSSLWFFSLDSRVLIWSWRYKIFW